MVNFHINIQMSLDQNAEPMQEKMGGFLKKMGQQYVLSAEVKSNAKISRSAASRLKRFVMTFYYKL